MPDLSSLGQFWSSYFGYAFLFYWSFGQPLALSEVLLVVQHMAFLPQCLPLSVRLAKGRQINFSTPYMYVDNVLTFNIFNFHVLWFFVAFERISISLCCRMELLTLSRQALLLSGTLGMYVIIPTSQLWMTYVFKGRNIMKLGLLFCSMFATI